MKPAPFHSSKLKVQRARHHIEDAAVQIERFLSERPYRLVAESDTDPAFTKIRLAVSQPLPEELPFIVGDAIHNLRAALDHLACDLVELNGKSSSDVYFPVAKKVDLLEKAIRDKNIVRASTAVVDFIRALKPYSGGNDAIAGLHTLDIVDKHLVFIPIGHVIGSPLPSSTQRGGTITLVPNNEIRMRAMETGDPFHLILSTPFLMPGDQMDASFDIAFGGGALFSGEPAVPLLRQLADYVERVIEAFASLCRGQNGISPPSPIILRRKSLGPLRID